MLRLIQLELQRTNLRPYCISSVIFAFVLLMFIYFAAWVAQVEQETQFMNYANLFRISSAVSMIFFSALSATMYAWLITKDYAGSQPDLLFSYPSGRQKVFMVKVFIVFSFIVGAMLLCTAVPMLIFAATESFAPIVTDRLSIELGTAVCRRIALALLAVSATGVLAFWLGFFKKSMAVTLISAFVLAGVYGNLIIGTALDRASIFMIIGVSAAAVLLALFTLVRMIDHMEVE